MRFFDGYASDSASYFIVQSDSVQTCHKTDSQYLSGSEHEDNFSGLDWRWEPKTLGAREPVFSLSIVAITPPLPSRPSCKERANTQAYIQA